MTTPRLLTTPRLGSSHRAGATWVLTSLLAAATLSATGAEPSPAFRIAIQDTGVYRLTFDHLVATGISPKPVPSAGLCLFQGGETVPIWVDDGDDGLFGPGDSLEFVGERLAGEGRYFHDVSPWNIYWLRLDRNFSHRMEAREPLAGEPDRPAAALRAAQHLERDILRIRLADFELEGAVPPELWYWAKLTHLDPEPFAVTLDLGDLQAAKATEAAPTRVDLRLRFFGLSYQDGFSRSEAADHLVEVRLNGQLLASPEWNGRSEYLLHLPDLPISTFVAGDNRLTLRVPARQAPNPSRAGKAAEPLLDVVMLDWIEVDYPRTGVVTGAQAQLRLGPNTDDTATHDTATHDTAPIVLTAPEASHLVAYGRRGQRIEAAAGRLAFEPGDENTFLIVTDRRLPFPAWIHRDRPSRLKDRSRFADYLMIAHPKLLQATTPLAELHRRRGLRVAQIDVQDVYDEFNHGIPDPRAIRDFLAYTHRHWLKPAPRFVLLVGDASWDTRNATVDDANYANWADRQLLEGDRFVARRVETYDGSTDNRRQLIPTASFVTSQGHSASDNWFVALEEGDHHPVMAIGRLPVTRPEEVEAIVAKTVRYVEQPEVGPWRRSSLWITNEQLGFQQVSDLLGAQASERGLGLHKVYPQPEETGNAAHQERLRQTLDEGQFLVHFLGHGGRYIWRTGPPDLDKNHDLFTLDDLERLEPSGRLPIVLSMTCFSAPFDHPNADSIGEKFLRLPNRGAIGVLAASWRTEPSSELSRALVDELTQPGTLGEAILRAKQRIPDRRQVETYNLLGDPAVPLPVPQLRLVLEPSSSEAEGLRVEVDVDRPSFRGRAVIDWMDGAGNALLSQELGIDSARFEIRFPDDPSEGSEVRFVRVYVWDPEAGIDGVGRAVVPAGDD